MSTIGIYWSQESWGGADTQLLTLLEAWPNGEDQFIIFSNRDNQGLPRLQQKLSHHSKIQFVTFTSLAHARVVGFFQNIKILFLLARVLFYFSLPVFYWLQYLQALRLFKKHPVQKLIGDNGAYPGAWACLAAMQAAKHLKIPRRVLLVHHAATTASRLRHWFDRWVDRKIASSVDCLVTVSQATYQTMMDTRDQALRKIPHTVIYNGVPEPKLETSAQIPSGLRLHADQRLLGIVGRVEEYKGHRDLIRAMGLLAPELRLKLRLIIVGSGDTAFIEDLRALVAELHLQEHVLFLGFYSGNIQNLMNELDLLVNATRDFEGFGLTLAEAMALGKPVLATRVGAIPEFVQDGACGRIVAPENPQELSAALKDFAEHPELWKKFGEQARQVISQFSDRKMSAEYAKVLS